MAIDDEGLLRNKHLPLSPSYDTTPEKRGVRRASMKVVGEPSKETLAVGAAKETATEGVFSMG